MVKLYKFLFTIVSMMLFSVSLFAQQSFFAPANETSIVKTALKRDIVPQRYNTISLDQQGIKSFLWALPSEKNVTNRNQSPVLEIPMPDGKMAKFHVWESSIQEPGLQAKFPEIRTFLGQGIDDPYAIIRFDYNPYTGFHAQILSVNGNVYIDPYQRGDIADYISYYTRDNARADRFVCGIDENTAVYPRVEAGPCRGTQLYTYRLAVACTGEYAIAVGGTTPALLHAAIVTSVNRVDGVYESEFAIRLLLVTNNNLIEYLDPNTDPFTGNNNTSVLINESQTVCTANIGSANFDIGHTFSTGAGGLAGLGVVCNLNNKGRGVTGITNPVGDNFDIDYVAHEMGHQFGCNHPFNGITSNCSGGNRNASTAYEVGSGTTIMGYAGICGVDDIQPHSDPFFHTISFDEMSNYAQGGGNSCKGVINTGNTLPVITSMNNNGANIPVNTPFTLTGSATDADGDAITYCWEEWDLGPATLWNNGNSNTTSPLFKSRPPKTTGSRTFPDISVILAGYPANPAATMGGLKGETLPTVARAMKFRLTVRDNRAGGGGVVTGGQGCQSDQTGTFQINTIATTGPFAVTAPNGGETYNGGSSQNITWNVVGTDQAPISVANVKISLSTDGGLTYPTVIAASTPNDGSEVLTIPTVVTTTARIKIEALGNIFFDISDANFTINLAPNGFTFNSPAPVVSSCPAATSLQTTLTATYNGTFTTPVNLTATANPAGTTVSFGTNPLTTGTTSTTVTLNGTNTLSAGSYTVTVTGTAGAIIQTRDIIFTITAGAGPAITTQPINQSACTGTNATFSVLASGSPAYQWQVSTDGGVTYTNISNNAVYSGATSATLNITGVVLSQNNYRYRAIASVQCGSTTSSAAILTVNTPPAVTTQPSDAQVCAGSSNTFTISATGAGLTYQWQLSSAGCAGPWTDIVGATSSSYTLAGITAGQTNTGYRCIVTGTCIPAATSNCAVLTVITSVAITSQPASAVVCEGSNTSFTVAGTGTGIIYQWQVSTDGGTTYTNVTNSALYSGATTATLNLTGATFALNTYKYRCQLSNATCTTPGVSNAATLTVNVLPSIAAQPQNATICVGGNNTFSSTGAGTGVTYQWQVSTAAVPAFTNIAGATAAAYTVTAATAVMNNNQYRIIVSGTCTPSVTSSVAVLTVISPVIITSPPFNAELCSGSNTSFTVAGSSTQTILYQWQVSTDNGITYTNIAGATSSTLTITGALVSQNNNLYRCQLSSSTCAAPTVSNPGKLTVRQLPTISLVAVSLNSLLPGLITTLTATPSAQTTGIITVGWIKDANSIINTGNTRVIGVDSIGNYQVTIQEAFSSGVVCSNQSAIVPITATVSDRLFIFPSPNDGQFKVSYYNSNGSSTTRSITVYDSKGAKVYLKQFPVVGPYTLLNIDMRSAQTGIYYVVVGDAAGKKLIEGKVLVH